MAGVPFGLLANFTAGYRKRNLIPFGLFSPNDNLNFIYTTDPGSMVSATGTINGTNAVFTVPSTSGIILDVRKNGVSQLINVMYTLVGNTITFLDPYVPQPGDYLQVQII